MNLQQTLSRVEKLVADNSPTILSAVAVTGAVATAYLTGKASYQAAQYFSDKDPYETIPEKAKQVWKLYIPAVSTGTLTVVCIIGANRIGNRRAAAMAAAYAVSERAWDEYKQKVIEKIGHPKEQRVRDEIAQDQINRNPVSKNEIIFIGNGEQLCYDSFSGRYFMSTMEDLHRAENEINRQINNNMYATLNEFYTIIGLSGTAYSSEVGWNGDNPLDLNFTGALTEDGKPCMSVNYHYWPIREYGDFH